MFYFFSKLLDIFIQPIFWMGFFIVLSYFKKRQRRKFAIISLLIFLIFGNSALFNKCIDALEYPAFDTNVFPEEQNVGILLGGYGAYSEKSDEIELNDSADRLSKTLALYHSGKINKILVLSGAASENAPEKIEADLTMTLLLESGVERQDIILETTSLNTHQNALNAKSIIEQNDLRGPFLLITSAFHMRRAKACFQTQGIETIAYPTDFRSHNAEQDIWYYIRPSIETMIDWNIITKELVGYIVYDMVGYID